MKTIDTIQLGVSASFTKTVTETDIILYAGISGDFNPAHIDSEHAKDSMFGQRIAHGMLSASFISNVLGTQLPGPGTIYLGQELRFVKPVYVGDTVSEVEACREAGIECLSAAWAKSARREALEAANAGRVVGSVQELRRRLGMKEKR